MIELGTESMFLESGTLNHSTVYSPKKSDNFFCNWGQTYTFYIVKKLQFLLIIYVHKYIHIYIAVYLYILASLYII